MFRTVLYCIWALIPIGYLLLALYSKLEQFSSKTKKHGRQATDFTRQSIFLIACVGIAILIDQYLLEVVAKPFLPDFIPLGLLQVMLLPIILYIGALLTGGSKPEHIQSAAKVSQSRAKGRK